MNNSFSLLFTHQPNLDISELRDSDSGLSGLNSSQNSATVSPEHRVPKQLTPLDGTGSVRSLRSQGSQGSQADQRPHINIILADEVIY